MSLLHYDIGGEYELSFDAWGEGVLCEENVNQKPEVGYDAFRKMFRRLPRDVSLEASDSSAFGYCITSVDTDFLLNFKRLRELILPPAVTEISMTPELGKLLKENDTLIRGSFDSFAERFAGENGLRFRPADLVIGRYVFEPADEITVASLKFRRDGSAYIRLDVSSPGSSAGNNFGGSFDHALDRDFWKAKTAEEIAGMFRDSMRNAILEKGALAEFLEKAGTHAFYTGGN